MTRPGEQQPRDDGGAEQTADEHADRHHAPGQAVEAGAPMDPGALPGERPQERGREHERVEVGEGEVGVAERLDRRRSPEEAEEREGIDQRGGDEEVAPQQPRPAVAPPREQEQASGRRGTGHPERQVEGEVAVLAPELLPPPQARHQRGRRPERGDRDERPHGEAHGNPAGQGGGRRGVSRRPEVGEQVGDEAQVLQRPAAGGCGLPGAPVPIDVLVERQGVRHVDDHTVATLLTHPTCLPLVRVPIRWPRPRPAGSGASIRIGVREAETEQAEAFRQRSSMMSPSRTTARRSAMRAASGLARRSSTASCR